jgi:hypothetical protein
MIIWEWWKFAVIFFLIFPSLAFNINDSLRSPIPLLAYSGILPWNSSLPASSPFFGSASWNESLEISDG